MTDQTDEIKRRLGELGLTQGDLAQAIGVTPDKISKIFSGTRQWRGTEMADSVRFLNGYRRPNITIHSPAHISAGDDEEMVEIPMLDLSLAMGAGTNIDDYIEFEKVKFALGFVRSFTRTPPHRLRIAKGVGESMFPTLMHNDLVWIDSTQTEINIQDRVWAISLFGAGAIKRLRRIAGGEIEVISDNPTVASQIVDETDLDIAGRVIRFMRDL